MKKKFLPQIENKKLFVFGNVALILFTLVLVWANPISNIKEYYVERYIEQGENAQEYIVDRKNSLVQCFSTSEANVDTIEIQCTTSKDKYFGGFSVALIDDTGNAIKQWELKKSILANNDWVTLSLDTALESDALYYLQISATDLGTNNSIKVKGTNWVNGIPSKGNISYQYCFYNDENIDGCIPIALANKHDNYFVLLATLLIFAFFNYYLFTKNRNITRSSFAYIMLLGMAIMAIMSPGSGPDEDYHYNSSLALSNVIMGKENISEVESEYIFDYNVHVNANGNFMRVIDGLSDLTINNPNEKEMIGERVYTLKYPISHFVPAIGMTIGRIAKLNGVWIYYLGRLSNLLMYAIILHIAIQLVPIKKDLFLIIALNPMALHQACSLSYDTIIYALSALYFALIVKYIYEQKEIKAIDFIVLLILLLLFGPIKTVYYAHALLLLAIPAEQFKGKIRKVLLLCACVAAIAGFTVVMNRIDSTTLVSTVVNAGMPVSTIAGINGDSNPYIPEWYYIQDALRNPLVYGKVLADTLLMDFIDLLERTFGSYFSSILRIPMYLVYAYIIVLAGFIFGDELDGTKVDAGLKCKSVFIGGAFVEALMLSCAGFLMTVYGNPSIQGLQGRYFIPCILPIAYAIGNKNVKVKIKADTSVLIMSFIYLGIVLSVMSQIVSYTL